MVSKEVFKEVLVQGVAYNCDVSDSRYWGYYSICGLLMGLRTMYMSAKGIEPWGKVDQAEVTAWIQRKEAAWEALEGEDFRALHINGTTFDPFDVAFINRALREEGLVYGAGYGLFKKPSFFLAKLDASSVIQGCNVYSAGKELARDLFWSPGQMQGRDIFLRFEPLKMLLWDKYQEAQAKNDRTLEYAFTEYGFTPGSALDGDFEARFDELTRAYAGIVLDHEIGESVEDVPEWGELLMQADDKQSEFFLRAVKDLIADTSDCGPIKRTIDEKKKGDLSFCIALIDRFRLKMYPELRQAFDIFTGNEDWLLIDDARRTVYARMLRLRDELVESYRASKDQAAFKSKIAELRLRLG